MIIFVLYAFCNLLIGVNGQPITDCIRKTKVNNWPFWPLANHKQTMGYQYEFYKCVNANQKLIEQKIVLLSEKFTKNEQQDKITEGLLRKLVTDVQQIKITATKQQTKLFQLTKR